MQDCLITTENVLIAAKDISSRVLNNVDSHTVLAVALIITMSELISVMEHGLSSIKKSVDLIS